MFVMSQVNIYDITKSFCDYNKISFRITKKFCCLTVFLCHFFISADKIRIDSKSVAMDMIMNISPTNSNTSLESSLGTERLVVVVVNNCGCV